MLNACHNNNRAKTFAQFGRCENENVTQYKYKNTFTMCNVQCAYSISVRFSLTIPFARDIFFEIDDSRIEIFPVMKIPIKVSNSNTLVVQIVEIVYEND